MVSTLKPDSKLHQLKTKQADEQAAYLEEKVVGSTYVNITEVDGAKGKALQIEIDGTALEGVASNKVARDSGDAQAGYLADKLIAGDNITLANVGSGTGKKIEISSDDPVFEATVSVIRPITAADQDKDFVIGSDGIAKEDVKKMTFNKSTGAFGSGQNVDPSGNYSHAEGYGTEASGLSSHAEGYGTTASGFYSHAEGYGTTASVSSSHAEGQDTEALGFNSHAEGYGTEASGSYSHAEGLETTASGSSSHAEGSETTASGSSSHAEGLETTASADTSHAGGRFSLTRNFASFARASSKFAEDGDCQTEVVPIQASATVTGETPDTEFNFNLLAGGDQIIIPEDSIVLFRLDIVTYVHQYQTSTVGEDDSINRAGYVRGYTVSGICWREGSGNVYIAEDGAGTDDGTVVENTFGFGNTFVEPDFQEGDVGGVYLPIRMKGTYDKVGDINYRANATLTMTVLGKPANDSGDTFGICTFDQDTNEDGDCDYRDL
jgi:hypothetical protein